MNFTNAVDASFTYNGITARTPETNLPGDSQTTIFNTFFQRFLTTALETTAQTHWSFAYTQQTLGVSRAPLQVVESLTQTESGW